MRDIVCSCFSSRWSLRLYIFSVVLFLPFSIMFFLTDLLWPAQQAVQKFHDI